MLEQVLNPPPVSEFQPVRLVALRTVSEAVSRVALGEPPKFDELNIGLSTDHRQALEISVEFRGNQINNGGSGPPGTTPQLNDVKRIAGRLGTKRRQHPWSPA